jgi:hypothetical protein
MVVARRVPWGNVELEPEVAEWLESLPEREFRRAQFYIDLLADRGPLLDQRGNCAGSFASSACETRPGRRALSIATCHCDWASAKS